MKSCLIVEDSKVVRTVIRRVVERLGLKCDEAENGEAAYQKCVSAMPDVIILDQTMPVMTGLEFLQKMREIKHAAPHIIFCSADNRTADIKAALDCGAHEYIMKPFDAAIIKSKLQILGLIAPGEGR